jgi:hypothetical protein
LSYSVFPQSRLNYAAWQIIGLVSTNELFRYKDSHDPFRMKKAALPSKGMR